MKKLSVFVLTFIMIFSMAACGSSTGSDNAGTTAPTQNSDTADNSSSAADGEITVTIDIDYPDSSKAADVDDARVVVADGSTVLDVLNRYAEDNNVEIRMDDTSSAPYVISIGGVEATDTAGWVYEVNDKTIMETADKHMVRNGDDIEWSFENWNDMDD